MRLLLALAFIPLFFGAAGAETVVDEDLDVEVQGIDGKEPLPRFANVAPGVYRSGQPNRAGLAHLAQIGVKTVLSLRFWRARGETEEVRRLGLRSVSVGMHGRDFPRFDQVDVALAVLADQTQQPVLVHCAYGKDRTGTVVAAWRVIFEGIDPKTAASEAARFDCCARHWKGSLEDWLVRYRRYRLGGGGKEHPAPAARDPELSEAVRRAASAVGRHSPRPIRP
ncbi:MAG: tyrosine-protein phosphatase [Elusimicrobia bacterium]|nr:tyrosine-protein phosphatase [Elusimicrobiota bacterium]